MVPNARYFAAPDRGRHRGLRGRLVHPRRGARKCDAIRHLPAHRRGRTGARPEAVRSGERRGNADSCRPALLQALHRRGRPDRKRPRGGARIRLRRRRRSPHRADADHDARGARADARTVHTALSRRTPAHRRGLQRAADRHGACRRTRFRGGADLRRPRRAEVAADRARSRDAAFESQDGVQAPRADQAQGLRAAENRRAEPRQRAAPQHRNLSSRPTASKSPT